MRPMSLLAIDSELGNSCGGLRLTYVQKVGDLTILV